MLSFIVGDSELARRIRDFDWTQTALGPPAQWPEALKTLVTIMMDSNQQMYVVWGPEQRLIYNDRYIEVLGGHHPAALGRPFLEVWREIARDLKPLVDKAYAGQPSYTQDIELIIARNGYPEETHFAYSYTPVRVETGDVGGFFCACIETTEQVKLARQGRESEKRYRQLFETMRQGYAENELIRDADGRAIDFRTMVVNPQFERLTGIPAGQAVGRTAREIVGKLDPVWLETYDCVVCTGKPERFEREEPAFGRWFEVQAYPLGGDRFAILYDDITERRRITATLRESEERQAFLLKLSDALRPLGDPIEAQTIAMRMLAERVNVMRASYFELEEDDDSFHLTARFERDAVPMPDRMRLSDFSPVLGDAYRSGRTLAVTDTRVRGELVADPGAYAAIGVGAWAAVPLMRGGKLAAWIGIHSATPRDWSAADLEAMKDVAERTWSAVEYARAEEALRESEKRHGFLLKFSDALRPLTGAEDILRVASQLAGEHWGMANANYARIENIDGVPYAIVRQSYAAPGRQSMDNDYRLADFPGVIDRLLSGERMIVPEIATDPYLTVTDKATYAAMDIANLLMVPLVRGGRLAAAFAVHGPNPKIWAEADVRLLEEVAERIWAALQRAEAEQTLRENDERQSFLLRLSDAIRPLGDPIAVQETVVRMLGEEMQVDRCYYAEFDWPRDVLTISTEYLRGASYSAIGEHPISAFQDLLQFSHKGAPLVCDEIAAHPIFKSEVAAYRARKTDGFILMPFVKEGVMRACMCVTMETPRKWSAAEVELVREVGNRTLEASLRARAEGALRESEERLALAFRTLPIGIGMLDGNGDVIMSNDEMRRFLPTGIIPSRDLARIDRWVGWDAEGKRVAPRDFPSARALRGEPIPSGMQMLYHDDEDREIWTEVLAAPLHDRDGRINGALAVVVDVDRLKRSEEALRGSEARQRILVAELQHRTRNLVAVIQSISDQTFANAGGMDQAQQEFRHRLTNLSRVQRLLSRADSEPVTIERLVRMELEALAAENVDRKVRLTGPDIALRPTVVQTLAMALHELATNAVKYGALSGNGGRIAVDWRIWGSPQEPRLLLEWTESGLHLSPEQLNSTHRGYGRELIEDALPYSLGAKTKFVLQKDGVTCSIDLPLDRTTMEKEP